MTPRETARLVLVVVGILLTGGGVVGLFQNPQSSVLSSGFGIVFAGLVLVVVAFIMGPPPRQSPALH